jgi:hypothetical protein
VAAQGWNSGAVWHLLPDRYVVEKIGHRRAVRIGPADLEKLTVPSGVALPSLALPIAEGKELRALLLCGSHEDGSELDPDEVRSIVGLCKDVQLVEPTVSDLTPAFSLKPSWT